MRIFSHSNSYLLIASIIASAALSSAVPRVLIAPAATLCIRASNSRSGVNFGTG
jgi:hypothetical protein